MKKLSSLVITGCLGMLTLSLNAQTVLTDGFGWPGTTPGELNGDINTNIPARQTGSATTTYTASFVSPVAGVILALENASPLLAGSPDNLFLRTQTGVTPGAPHNINIALDTSFTALATRDWAASYTGRLTIGGGAIGDSFLGFGLGTTSRPTGGDADGFFFAVRPGGEWLLFRNGGTLTSGTLTGFTAQQQYSVNLGVNETGAMPTLSVSVTPLGGSAQSIASDLGLNAFGANRYFAFNSSAVSENNGAFTDARITGLELTVIPEPSSLALLGAGFVWLAFRKRRKRI